MSEYRLTFARSARKIRGGRSLWRIRVGVHRIVYRVDDPNRVVDIIVVRHRGAAYR